MALHVPAVVDLNIVLTRANEGVLEMGRNSKITKAGLVPLPILRTMLCPLCSDQCCRDEAKCQSCFQAMNALYSCMLWYRHWCLEKKHKLMILHKSQAVNVHNPNSNPLLWSQSIISFMPFGKRALSSCNWPSAVRFSATQQSVDANN